MNKNIKFELVMLLILNIVITSLCGRIIVTSLETVIAMAEGKTPVTIIMYHSILKENKRKGDYVISPLQFENDIKYLKDKGYNFITVTDIIEFVKKKRTTLPENPVVITFDDGYYNNYLYAYPIMKTYNAPFVISIIGKWTDLLQENEEQRANYSHISWEQIKEMDKSGIVEIQNHSYDLHSNTNKRYGAAKNSNESESEYEKVLSDDVMKLQKLLKEKTGIEPNTFTYPFGRISKESVEILKGLNFEAMLSCYEGVNFIAKGDENVLYHLKRFNRPYGKSSEDFFRDKLK